MKDSPAQSPQEEEQMEPSARHQATDTEGNATKTTQSTQSKLERETNEPILSSSPPRRRRHTPVDTTPSRDLNASSVSNSDVENDSDNIIDDVDVGIASFHNSRGTPVNDRDRNNSKSRNNKHPVDPESDAPSPEAPTSSASADNGASCSADQERQILLLMLLAQVCALHDPTPRTFTVHVLELFERGILGRQSIHFLFELGLVPTSTPRLLTNGEFGTTTTSTGSDSREDVLDLHMAAVTTTGGPDRTPTSPQTLRSREASAIRSSLEQHERTHQLMQQAMAGGVEKSNDYTKTFHPKNGPTLVTSPTSGERLDPDVAASPNNNDCSMNDTTAASSWAVENHPLSLSRYQREFHQVRLLNAGSFGEVFQSTNKVDLKDYAVKRVAFSAWGYSKDSVSQVIREVHCLAQCDHPNVCRYYTSWLEPSWMTGSGATMMMSSTDENSAVEVRRQQKLLTDIQHMMVTGGANAGGGEGSASYSWGDAGSTGQSLIPNAHQDQQQEPRNHIQDFFQEQAGVLRRNRQFSIGSSMDSFHSDDGDDSGELLGESSYDETSSSEDEKGDDSAWSIEESRVTSRQEDSIFFEVSHNTVPEGEGITTTQETSVFFEKRHKEVWESSASLPRQPCNNNTKKNHQKTSAARLKYRYQICLFIQMQLCHPATLGDWIRKRNSQCDDPKKNILERVQTAAAIFGQIVGGLDHIHKKGIVHRDLKPANLFQSLEEDGVFLIGDFGLSKLIHSATHHRKSKAQQTSSKSTSLPRAEDMCQALVVQPPTALAVTKWQDPLTAGVGTASYAAPEQVTTETYGMKADIFSLGLILLEMFCCFTTEHERMQTFSDCRHRRDIPSWISQDYPVAAKTILDCTDPNPSIRPSTEDLLKVARNLVPSPDQSESESVPKESAFSAGTMGDLECVRRELGRKNSQLFEYEQKLKEKDSTILQLRRELAQLKLMNGVNSQPIRGMSDDGLDVNDVASSSSSSDGCT